MTTLKFQDKASLKRFLDTIVAESIDKAKSMPLLKEDYAELQKEADDEKTKQEKMKAAKGDVDKLFGGGEEEEAEPEPEAGGGGEEGGGLDLGTDDLGGEDQAQDLGGDSGVDTSDAAAQAAKTVTVTEDVNGVIELLNLVRSGRSLKNAEVLEELTQWVDQMSDSEKLALVTFLEGIKDIVTAGESAQDATEPEDKGIDISSDKEEEGGAQQQPGQVVTGESPPPRRGSVSSVEDTSAPIVIGSRNEAFIRAYRDKIRKLIGD